MIRKLIEKTSKKIKGNNYSIDINIPTSYLVLLVCERVIMLIRGFLIKCTFKKAGRRAFLGRNVTLKCRSKLVVGTNSTICDKVYIDALSINGCVIGDNCSIGSGTIIRCTGNLKNLGNGFEIGDGSSLADNCFVGASGGVRIGKNVIGGQSIRFHSSNHKFERSDLLIKDQGVESKGIVIGNNCWIGSGVVFCDGVTIGDGCVVGADTVVTKSYPDDCVIVGCGSRVIKYRGDSRKDDVQD